MFGNSVSIRMSRGVTWALLLAVLAGQVGLPSWPNLAAEEKVGCQCALWARALGRCCCRTQNLPAKKSCCANKAQPVRRCCSGVATKPPSKPATRPGVNQACPCDEQSSVALLRCHEPRVIAVRPTVSRPNTGREFLALNSEWAAGDRPRPDVPPPRRLTRSAVSV